MMITEQDIKTVKEIKQLIEPIMTAKELRNEIVNRLWSYGNLPKNIQTLMTDNEVDFVMEVIETHVQEQLIIADVVSSSDLIVVELSDEEIKIITEKELNEWRKSAIEFDGFEGWIVRGRLVK